MLIPFLWPPQSTLSDAPGCYMVTETLAALAQPAGLHGRACPGLGTPLWNLFPNSRLSDPDPDTHLDTSANLKFQCLHLLNGDHDISL